MIKEDIKRKPGMMLYFDIFDNVVKSCTAEEIGNLIIAAYQHQNGQDTREIFSDPKLDFIYGTLINSIDRDTEAYFEKCFRTSINKRFADYKKSRGTDDSSRDRWETENAVMIEEIHQQYEQAKQYALGNGTIIDTNTINKFYKKTFGTEE